ncbi:ABC transporter permease [Bacillus luteolus]|uniref:ABC transporter permease n=1 Tax=Litchfieldia luteola TaxID=682179 RepID=A0ABR9QJ53_9BACI|nr:ABC transporter permease [Cytobacillus luteolus]MBE4908522.1 ABC transporter permease [Cytobacillus luteolus]MBP1941374.1 peptide/nickel transport system permease protein [Cytobacillus luteolus]
MKKYLIKRILQSIPILIGITIMTFAIMQMAPGNPMQTMIDPKISSEEMQRAQENLGLNDPLHVQYFTWIKEVLSGNLGYTIKTGQPVGELILERLPATLLLTGTAFIIAFTIGVPLGVYSATHRYKMPDYVLTVLSFIGISIPSFFFGLGMIFIFALKLGWLPTSGMVTIGANYTGFALFIDYAKHVAMPAIVLALPTIAVVMRFTRSSMLEVLNQDFIRTADSKGLSKPKVYLKHALRNALIPVITIFGLSIPFLFGGAYITEHIFNWPGMGSLGIQSIVAREYPVIMALNLFTSILVMSGNLLADVMYAWADPRIRY